jgi:peroxiredoxin
MPDYANVLPGDPAPWFRQRSLSNSNYAINSAGGRYIVLCFFATAANPQSQAAIAAALARKDLFNDQHASFFGVSLDPADEREQRVVDGRPGYRYLWDFDGRASRLYGAISQTCDPSKGQVAVRLKWVVLDPTLRVLRVFPFAADTDNFAAVMAYVAAQPPPSRFAGVRARFLRTSHRDV